MASEDDSKVFIGIDCGTTYSGFCFAMGRDCKDYHVQPQAGDGQKIPTALLLKKDGSFKCAFGQPAIDDYSTLEEEEKKELLFYDRFKMALFFVKSTGNALIHLRAENGLALPATTVFARVLEHFKKEAQSNVGRRTGVDWNADEVTWIVTVPAIWGERARGVMKAAAIEAGLTSEGPSDKFEIILEPDAAAVACLDEMKDVWKAAGQPEKLRYIVADCGGGTVDVAVHDRRMTGSHENAIAEVIHPSGGPWGGTVVDQNILNYIKSLLGEHVKKVDESTWEQLERLQIEKAKRTAYESEVNPTQVKVELGPEIVTKLATAGVDLKAVLDGVEGVDYRKRAGAIMLDIALFEKCFDEPCRDIVNHLQKVVAAAGNVHCLILVGGFSESPTLRRRLESGLPKMKIIKASEPSLAVVKGAVIYGQNPQIMQRVAPRPTRLSLQDRNSRFSMQGRNRAFSTSQLDVEKRRHPSRSDRPQSPPVTSPTHAANRRSWPHLPAAGAGQARRPAPKPPVATSPSSPTSPTVRDDIPGMAVQLLQQRWYHGIINRQEAEVRLLHTRPGSYLVRISGNDHVLSVKASSGFHHIKIIRQRDGKYIMGGEGNSPFDTIASLIDIHSQYGMKLNHPTTKKKEMFVLRFPLDRPPR